MLASLFGPPDGKATVFNPAIIRIEPEKQPVWLGRILFPGLFDGEHHFLTELLTEEHVTFCHNEIFSGLLSRLVMKLIGKSTEDRVSCHEKICA